MSQGTKLERTVRRLISKASDLKHRRVHELLDELRLHRGQAFVLYALWEQDGITQSELVERLNRSPSTITKTVQRMEKAGFVQRCSDESDERVSRVCLTGAGRDIRPAVEEVWNRLDRQISQPLRRIAEDSFPELGQRLTRLEAALADPRSGPENRTSAVQQFDAIIRAMREVLSRMIELEDFNQAIALLREIIEAQERLIGETKKEKLRGLLED